MSRKLVFNDFRKESKSILSKVFNKIGEIGNTSIMRMKISNLKAKIKNNKQHLGEFIISNRKKFEDIPEINADLQKIKNLEEDIKLLNKQINEAHEKYRKETKVNSEST